MKKLTKHFFTTAAAVTAICSMTFLLTACGNDEKQQPLPTSTTSQPGTTTVKATTSAPETTSAAETTTATAATVTTPADIASIETTTAPAETGTEDTPSVFPKALENVEAIFVPDIPYTGWEFSGGMVDGREMEENDVAAILEACGGFFYFIFGDPGNVSMANGESTFTGTYTVISDGYILDIIFEGYEYYGVFTNIEDITVMILANKADSETAFYMLPMEG